jgi:hypothetical protein
VALSDLSQLFRDLGGGRNNRALSSSNSLLGGLVLPESTSQAGRQFFEGSDEGNRALFTLYLSQFDPATRRALEPRYGDIAGRWKAASALDNSLSFERFLDDLDVQRYVGSELTSFQRGERPQLFTRGTGGYRYLQG